MADVNGTATKKEAKIAISPGAIVIGLAVLAGIGLFGWLTFGPSAAPAAQPVLTNEAKAYLPYLKLTDVQPQTSESYIQRSLFEIMGTITNNGTKTVRSVEVNCVFRDSAGHEIKRELVSVLSASGPPLKPGASKPFRLAFDDLPDDWSQQMPDFVIAQIRFA